LFGDVSPVRDRAGARMWLVRRNHGGTACTARAVDEKGWQLTKGGGSAEDTAPVVGGTLACADSKAPARQRKARRGN